MKCSNRCFIVILYILICTFSVSAQSTELTLEEKRKISLEVFNKLKQTKGLISKDHPQLEIMPFLPDKSLIIAMFNGPSQKIILQEKTFDICMQLMGRDSLNGLAFILAHELAHYTKQHKIRQQFIANFQSNANAGTELANQLNPKSTQSIAEIEQLYDIISTKHQIRKNEAEADLEAGFMSYLAGFKSIEAGPKFLDLAYQVYEINTQPDKYASLSERQEIVRKTGLKLDTLIHVYETANLLSTAGEYEYAAKCYEYISKIYQSKELLNNMAVLNMQAVASGISRSVIPYVLPITMNLNLLEIDDNVQLDLTPEFIASLKQSIQPDIDLLDAAYTYLDRALEIDPRYAIAGINKSVCQLLQYGIREQIDVYDNVKDYLIYAEADILKIKNKFDIFEDDPKLFSTLYETQSIIANLKNDISTAVHYNNLAFRLDENNFFAKSNKAIIAGDTSILRQTIIEALPPISLCDQKEPIFDSIILDDTFKNQTWTMSSEIWVDHLAPSMPKSIKVQHAAKKAYTIYNISIIQEQEEIDGISFFTTNENYKKKSGCGIKLSNSSKKLNNKYGENSKTTHTKTSRFEAYSNSEENKSGIIFKIDNQNNVAGWSVYQKL